MLDLKSFVLLTNARMDKSVDKLVEDNPTECLVTVAQTVTLILAELPTGNFKLLLLRSFEMLATVGAAASLHIKTKLKECQTALKKAEETIRTMGEEYTRLTSENVALLETHRVQIAGCHAEIDRLCATHRRRAEQLEMSSRDVVLERTANDELRKTNEQLQTALADTRCRLTDLQTAFDIKKFANVELDKANEELRQRLEKLRSSEAVAYVGPQSTRMSHLFTQAFNAYGFIGEKAEARLLYNAIQGLENQAYAANKLRGENDQLRNRLANTQIECNEKRKVVDALREELASTTTYNNRLKAELSAHSGNSWWWQEEGGNNVDSLTCPVMVPIHVLKGWLNGIDNARTALWRASVNSALRSGSTVNNNLRKFCIDAFNELSFKR